MTGDIQRLYNRMQPTMKFFNFFLTFLKGPPGVPDAGILFQFADKMPLTHLVLL
jgi:hypothetical protein